MILEERTFGMSSNEASEDGVGVELLEEEFGPDVEGKGERDESDRSSELRKGFGGKVGLMHVRKVITLARLTGSAVEVKRTSCSSISSGERSESRSN